MVRALERLHDEQAIAQALMEGFQRPIDADRKSDDQKERDCDSDDHAFEVQLPELRAERHGSIANATADVGFERNAMVPPKAIGPQPRSSKLGGLIVGIADQHHANGRNKQRLKRHAIVVRCQGLR